MKDTYNFAIIGVGGYIAPKHLQAINETGNILQAALDTNDSVGVLDQYFPKAKFFTEFERFDRYIDKISNDNKKKIQFLSICSPNWLHDYHIKFALRNGLNIICEKPLVITPWNLDRIEELEKASAKKIFTVLQLRLHPSIIALKKKIKNLNSSEKHEVILTYITPRGPWYLQSWKGDISKSGGIATNIGIHFFDMLISIFGTVVNSEVYFSKPKKMSGFLELKKANIRWYLSTDVNDLQSGSHVIRYITIDGEKSDFSSGFSNLHTKVYENIFQGKGFRIKDARPSIELSYKIRNSEITHNIEKVHPLLRKILENQKDCDNNLE